MRNKNYLYRQQRVQGHSHTAQIQQQHTKNPTKSNIFDIHFIFYQPAAHTDRNTHKSKTLRKHIKNTNIVSPPSTPEPITHPYPEIKMILEPTHPNYQSNSKAKQVKFNQQQKIQTIHSVQYSKSRAKSNEKFQHSSDSRLLSSEAKKKLKEKIIQGTGLINFLQCSTLDIGGGNSKTLIVDQSHSRTLHRTLIKTYSQRWRHNSDYTRKTTFSRRQQRGNQSKMVSPWSPTHRQKQPHNTYDLDLLQFLN